MLGKFIEASINFTNSDIFLMYGVMAVAFFGIAIFMFITSQKDD